MKIFRLKSPERIFITYSGSIKDTAAVVGLYNQRTKVDQIIFTGMPTLESMGRISELNAWLRERDWPLVSYNETSSGPQLIELKSSNPLQDWNWGEDECLCVLKLAGFKV